MKFLIATTSSSLDINIKPQILPAAVALSLSKIWWVFFFLGWVALCAPLFVVEIPPLADYPNHLERMSVLSNIRHDARLQAIYEVKWGIIPDLAIDIFVPILMGFLPGAMAGKVLLALIALLDVGGAAAYAAALHRRRTWWSLGAALVTYNIAFMMGFLNFEVSAGLALPLAACWIWLRRAKPITCASFGIIAATILFFSHLMGLFFFLALIGSFEGSIQWSALRQRRWRLGAFLSLAPCAWPLLPALIPPAVLYPMTGLRHVGGETSWLPWNERAIQAMGGLINYNFYLDVFSAGAILFFILGAAALRRLAIAHGAVIALLVIGGLYPALPHQLKGTSYVDTRLAVMLAFLAFTALDVKLCLKSARLAVAAFSLLFIVRMGVVSRAWIGWREDITNTSHLADLITPGDRIIQIGVGADEIAGFEKKVPTAWHLSNDQMVDYHLASWYFSERGAFWPGIFANPDQQPLDQREPFKALRKLTEKMPDHIDLVARRKLANLPAPNPYCAFDKVLLNSAWGEPHLDTLAPDWMELVAANRTAALYQVRGARACADPLPVGVDK